MRNLKLLAAAAAAWRVRAVGLSAYGSKHSCHLSAACSSSQGLVLSLSLP